ncbi:MAG TPA: lysophospholipid acyltransferase family protein [Lacipirellula sp.]
MPPLKFVNGAYRTPPRQVPALYRAFPSLAFHPRLIRSVFHYSAEAKRGRYGDQQWIDHSLYVMRVLESVGCQFEITGVDHLERLDGPCVIAANHMSTLETAVLPSIVQPILPVTFVVKQSLIDYPVFRHIMRARNPIAVSQTDPRSDLKTMLHDGAARIAEGVSLVVFPEGRRSPVFDPARFNTIAVKLAHRAQAPVVPLALYTNAWSLGRGQFTDFGRIYPQEKVRFAFGEPLRVTGRGADENRAIIDFIEEHLERWRIEDGRPAPSPADLLPEPAGLKAYQAGDV